jgi:hypothetical protein
MGFPDIPALMDPSKPSFAPHAPEAGRFDGKPEFPFINPVLDYDWGPEFNPSDGSGVPTKLPPPIRRVIKMMVPRVDADGNELGGVPVVLRDAPLGTYLGWNITVSGFHKGQNCNYTGGVIPFARTKAERDASKDPRPSLQERYTDHPGYVGPPPRCISGSVLAELRILQRGVVVDRPLVPAGLALGLGRARVRLDGGVHFSPAARLRVHLRSGLRGACSQK